MPADQEAPRPERLEAAPGAITRRPWWGTLLVLAPVAILAMVLYLVRLPYLVLSPGPAKDVEPLIHIDRQQTYPSAGHFLLTSVSYVPAGANAYDVVRAWIDPALEIVPESSLFPPGETQEEQNREFRSQMDTSKIDAAVVALSRYTGYPERHGPGALVEEVFPGTPADGKLFSGDLIVKADGEPVDDVDELGRLIRGAGVGSPLRLTVRAAGRTRNVSLAPAKLPDVDRPVIGVSLVANFPFPLTIRSGDIGGPSAGLMWTLGLTDLLTPGDLTGGRSVAGTGEILLDGTVRPISGVEQKVVAAERAGAAVFFAPVANAADARAAGDGILVVPVRSFLDALTWLQDHP